MTYDDVTRRWFLKECAVSLGTIALHTLFQDHAVAARGSGSSTSPGEPLAPRPPHFRPRAKNVIFLFMAGGPSHLELFDYKSRLQALDGQPIPDEFIKGQRFA